MCFLESGLSFSECLAALEPNSMDKLQESHLLFALCQSKTKPTYLCILILMSSTLFLSGAEISVENYVGQTWIVGLLSKFFVK